MVSEKLNNDVVQNFIIENNIIKGVEKKFDLTNQSIGQVILKKFNDNPNHVAQIEAETGKKTIFDEMKDNCIRCALWMQKQGIGIGDVVAICTHNHMDAYIPCIATFFVGAIYNPWHHEVPLISARHFMNLIRPKIIFSCESAVSVLEEAAKLEKVETKIIVFGNFSGKESLKDILKSQTNEDVKKFQVKNIENTDNIAMILFSSGTTGLPKGVAHSYKSLLRNILGFVVAPFKECISLWYSSLYWISGTFCMLQALLTGATRILHERFDPEETCKVIEKFKINWFFIPPSTITHLYKSDVFKNYQIKSMKCITTGGAKLSREIIEDFKKSLPHVSIVQAFGMTELGGIATIQTNQCKNIESVGFVVPNIKIKIIDIDNGKILGSNESGEICVKSPTVMLGYYKNPTATKATIDNEGWLHTGDKGYYAENGELFIIDRIKEVMKFRGHQISPFEIEEILLSHPFVIEVAVVPIPHELDLERPMAFVKKVPGAKITEEELIKMSAALGDHKKLWGGVKFIDKIPYTASGKISRKDLKELAKSYTRR